MKKHTIIVLAAAALTLLSTQALAGVGGLRKPPVTQLQSLTAPVAPNER